MKIIVKRFDKDDERGAVGYYDEKTRTIYIEKNQKLIQRVITLFHEFGHYCIDRVIKGEARKTLWHFVYDCIGVLIDGRYAHRQKRTIRWYIKHYFMRRK